jgi:hypothetical protein
MHEHTCEKNMQVCEAHHIWRIMGERKDELHGLINYVDSKAKCRHLKN